MCDVYSDCKYGVLLHSTIHWSALSKQVFNWLFHKICWQITKNVFQNNTVELMMTYLSKHGS